MALRSPGTYRSALANRPFRLALASYALASTAQATWTVAIAIALYQQTGSGGWAAVAASSRLLPYILVSPVAGVVADRYGHRRTLEVTGLIRIVLAALVTAGIAMGAPALLLAALAFAATTAATPLYPTLNAFVPTAVAADDLAVANSLLSTVETVCWIVGPAVGGLLAAAASPTAAAATSTALLVGALVLVRLVPVLPSIVDRAAAAAEPLGAAIRGGLRAIQASGSARVVLTLLLAINVISGSGEVLLLLYADRRLSFGDAGYGLLNAALAVGAMAAVVVNRRMAAGPRPLRPLVTALVVAGMTYASLGALASAAGALAVLVLLGGATVVADVVAVTVLQRTVPTTHLARVFGLLDALVVSAIFAGAAVAPLVERAVGLDLAFVVTGAVVPLLTLAVAPLLARAGAVAETRRAQIQPILDVLAQVALLRHAPDPVLESLAAAGRIEVVAAGTTVIRQGDEPDDAFVVLRGTFTVHIAGADGAEREVNRCGPGECLGEIGLLARVRRTATVEAVTDAELFRIPGPTFVEAVNGSGLGSGASAAAGIVSRVANPVEAGPGSPRDAPDLD